MPNSVTRATFRTRRDLAHPGHICARTGLTPATSAPGLGSPFPNLHPAGLGSHVPHLHQNWALPCSVAYMGPVTQAGYGQRVVVLESALPRSRTRTTRTHTEPRTRTRSRTHTRTQRHTLTHRRAHTRHAAPRSLREALLACSSSTNSSTKCCLTMPRRACRSSSPRRRSRWPRPVCSEARARSSARQEPELAVRCTRR